MKALQLNFIPKQRATVVDVSICGDILRVVMDGFPELKATNPAEILQELRQHHNDFRHFLIDHPRGHEYVNACLLLPPFSKKAVRTLVVAPSFGYSAVAGTLLMAATTALIETNQISIDEPITEVTFDTAQGQYTIIATIENGRCVATRWLTNKPRIIFSEQTLKQTDGSTISVSLIHSGLPYIIVRAVDLQLNMDDISALGQAGLLLSGLAETQLDWQTNDMKQGVEYFLFMIVGEFNPLDNRVAVAWVSPTGSVAFSPSGTGALAVAGYFQAQGQLARGTELITVTPSGCCFRCQLDAQTAYVKATAQVIALSELILDPLQITGK
jgi:proline racemase